MINNSLVKVLNDLLNYGLEISLAIDRREGSMKSESSVGLYHLGKHSTA